LAADGSRQAIDVSLHVAIVNLTSGGISGGYLKYLHSLLPLLRRDARISQLDVFVPEGVRVDAGGPVRSWPLRDAFRGYAALRRDLKALAPDVVFFPTARLIDCGRVPAVVMVRNMEPLTVPFGGNTWREALRNVARARVARQACRRASRVIAVSDHVRRFVTERWGLPAGKVGRVYHGIDATGAPPVPPQQLEGMQRFVFTAGSIRPARGLEDLIRAAPALIAREPSLKIVIAGKPDASTRPYETRMRRLSERVGAAAAIAWPGQLGPAEMAWGYERCAAFVVTSRAEACPNVALEALAHGAPVVSTSQDPMPEFFAGTAAYYRPKDPAELAARLASILTEPESDRARRRAAAIARAAEFPWSRTAEETIVQLQLAIVIGSVLETPS
jgi:glycosyltransferase involved in cell wall biosynthesis